MAARLLLFFAAVLAAVPQAFAQRPALGQGEGGRRAAESSMVVTRSASDDSRVPLKELYKITGPTGGKWLLPKFEYEGYLLRSSGETAPFVEMHMDLCAAAEFAFAQKCLRPIHHWPRIKVFPGKNPETPPRELLSGTLTSQYVIVWYRDGETQIRNLSTPFSIRP